MRNRYKKLSKYFLFIGLIMALFGITYSFFMYTSFSNQIIANTGEVYMRMLKGEENNIVITHGFPETYEEAINHTESDKNYVEFTIIGKNEYKKPVYYELDLVHGDVPNNYLESNRIEDKYLNFELTDITDPNNVLTLLKDVNFNDLTNQRIYIDTINSNENNYSRTYRLRMWFDENIIISDSKEYANFRASDALLNDPEYSYNASKKKFSDLYSSIKVRVFGDFIEKSGPFAYLQYQTRNVSTGLSNPPEFDIVNKKIKKYYNLNYLFPTDSLDNTITNKFENYVGNIQNINFVKLTDSTIESYQNDSLYTKELQEDENSDKIYLFIVNNSSSKYDCIIGSKDIIVFPEDSSNMFGYNINSNIGFTSLEHINFDNIYTGMTTNMDSMFMDLYNIEELDLKKFNTKNVESMNAMFCRIGRLTPYRGFYINSSNSVSLDLSSFITSKVTDLSYAFAGSAFEEIIGIENLNTKSVVNMIATFGNSNFSSDTFDTLNLSKWNTSNVENLCHKYNNLSIAEYYYDEWINPGIDFYSKDFELTSIFGATKVTTVNISNWDLSNCLDLNIMFDEPIISNMILNRVKFNKDAETYFMFNFQTDTINNCAIRLTNLQLPDDVTNTIGIARLGCIVDLSNSSTGSTFNRMTFWRSSPFTYIFDNFNTSKCTDFHEAFIDYSGSSLNVSSFDTSRAVNMSRMFSSCSSLTSLDLSNFNTRNVTNMYEMFSEMSNLTSLNISRFNTSNVTDMGGMFNDCFSLKELDLSSFNTSNVVDTSFMFNYAYELETIYASELWNLSNVTNSYNMFYGIPVSGKRMSDSSEFRHLSTSSHPEYDDKTYAKIYTDTQDGFLTDYRLKPVTH